MKNKTNDQIYENKLAVMIAKNPIHYNQAMNTCTELIREVTAEKSPQFLQVGKQLTDMFIEVLQKESLSICEKGLVFYHYRTFVD